MKIIFIHTLISGFILLIAGDYVYYPNIKMYYKFYKTPMTWGKALLHCKSENATLAMPRNQNEIDELVNLFQRYPKPMLKNFIRPDHVMIGFHDLFTEGEFLMLDGNHIQYGYHHWNPKEPNSGNVENCGSFHRSGGLNDFWCYVNSPFICQKVNQVPEKHTEITFSKDDAYVYSPTVNKSYKLHMDLRTWGMARTICKAEGGSLAVVRNKKEEDILVNMLKDPKYKVTYSNMRFAFIGFHDLFNEGHYETVNGEDLYSIGYLRWASDVLHSTNKFNCGAIDANSGALTDYNCGTPTVFICERCHGSENFEIDARNNIGAA